MVVQPDWGLHCHGVWKYYAGCLERYIQIPLRLVEQRNENAMARSIPSYSTVNWIDALLTGFILEIGRILSCSTHTSAHIASMFELPF